MSSCLSAAVASRCTRAVTFRPRTRRSRVSAGAGVRAEEHSNERLPVRPVGVREARQAPRGRRLMSVTAASPLATLAGHHDMALETRKRDGTWIATPVNPLVEDDHVFFRTWRTSGKAKRLRNFADVRFAPSTARGRPTGDWLQGRATLLDGEAAAQ